MIGSPVGGIRVLTNALCLLLFDIPSVCASCASCFQARKLIRDFTSLCDQLVKLCHHRPKDPNTRCIGFAPLASGSFVAVEFP